MLVKIYSYLTLFSIVIAIIGLYTIKDKVNTLNYQVEQISAQINIERDSIHMIKAEFAYLCAPNRIKDLASSYLNLQSLKTSQMIADPISNEEPKMKVSASSSNLTKPIHNVKWRYKRINNRYIQNVSKK